MKKIYTKSAFTLVEIILVVLLLSVVVAMATPNFRNSYRGYQLKQNADSFSYLMRYAQSRAIMRAKIVQLKVDANNFQYWLQEEKENDPADELENPIFEKIKGRHGKVQDLDKTIEFLFEDDHIDFYPTGAIDKVEVQMCNASSCVMITTKQQRGRVYVSNVFEK